MPIGTTPNWTDIMGLRIRQFEYKNGNMPGSGAETTIFELASGAGCIVSLWMTMTAVSSGYPSYDDTIRIFTDGNVSPDMDQDLCTFFGFAHAMNFSAGALSTQNFAASANGQRTMGQCLLPMPFSNGVKITLANPAAAAAGNYFIQVAYALTADNPAWTPPAYRLHTEGVTVTSNTAGPSHTEASFTLHSLTGSGIIVAHSMEAASISGVTGDAYLERNISLTIDGEGSPSIQSSGTEDWFRDPWYFGWGLMSSPTAMAWGLFAAEHRFSALVDIAALNGGYKFESSAVLTWDQNSYDTATDCSHYADCLFYYVPA